MNGNINYFCIWILKFSLLLIVLIKIKKKNFIEIFVCIDFYGCRGFFFEDVLVDVYRSLRWKLYLFFVFDGCYYYLCFVF